MLVNVLKFYVFVIEYNKCQKLIWAVRQHNQSIDLPLSNFSTCKISYYEILKPSK